MVVSEGKVPKLKTETRVSSKQSKKSQTEVKKPERMTFGPSANPESKQEIPQSNDLNENLPFQFK